MRGVRPAFWIGPRGIAALVVAALVADLLARAVPWPVATLLVAALVVLAFALDARAGRGALSLRRISPARFALARRDALRYEVENRAPVGLRFGIVEAPVARLAIALEGVHGEVAARSRTAAELAFVPHERGRTALAATFVWYETQLGLVRHRRRRDDPQPIRVLPNLSDLDASHDLALRARLIEHGLRRLRQRGVGTEFSSLREYEPGDPFRAIDWKASARRNRVMVVQHEIERSQHVIVALDAGRLMSARLDDRRKLDYSVSAALALATLARLAGDRIGVHAFASRTLAAIAPGNGPAHAATIADVLADLEPTFEESDYEGAALELRAMARKRSLIVVLTDLLDPAASTALLGALAILTRHHVVVVALMNDAALAAELRRAPADVEAAYRASVAASLAAGRDRAVAQLRARGMLVVDVPAPELTLGLLDAYVEVKTRRLL